MPESAPSSGTERSRPASNGVGAAPLLPPPHAPAWIYHRRRLRFPTGLDYGYDARTRHDAVRRRVHPIAKFRIGPDARRQAQDRLAREEELLESGPWSCGLRSPTVRTGRAAQPGYGRSNVRFQFRRQRPRAAESTIQLLGGMVIPPHWGGDDTLMVETIGFRDASG